MPTCDNYTFIAIIILYIFALIYFINSDVLDYFTTVKVRGDDGVTYKLQSKLSGQDVALTRLLEVNRRVVALGQHLKKKFKSGVYCPEKAKQVQNILKRYNPDKLVENSPKIEGESSYTLDKGALVAMCLRDKKSFDVHDFDTIMFVYLHELAHLATDVVQHEVGFWRTFKWLLGEAEEAGVYTNVDFKKTPMDYCGHHVNYSPYYDNSLKDLCLD